MATERSEDLAERLDSLPARARRCAVHLLNGCSLIQWKPRLRSTNEPPRSSRNRTEIAAPSWVPSSTSKGTAGSAATAGAGVGAVAGAVVVVGAVPCSGLAGASTGRGASAGAVASAAAGLPPALAVSRRYLSTMGGGAVVSVPGGFG